MVKKPYNLYNWLTKFYKSEKLETLNKEKDVFFTSEASVNMIRQDEILNRSFGITKVG